VIDSAPERGESDIRASRMDIRWPVVVELVQWTVLPKVGGIDQDRGLNGFDFARRIKGSVPVQARDHRKRRCNQLSADSHQRDYALAA
jgi:hypothetical protein